MAWHSLLYSTGTMEEAATCPALPTTQTLAGAVNNPLGNLPVPSVSLRLDTHVREVQPMAEGRQARAEALQK